MKSVSIQFVLQNLIRQIESPNLPNHLEFYSESSVRIGNHYRERGLDSLFWVNKMRFYAIHMVLGDTDEYPWYKREIE